MKKILLYLIIIIILGIGFDFLNTVYFSGTEKIKILKDYEKITSLNELINHSDFINKNLYIDFYSTSCSSAINQFNYLPGLKKDINLKDLVFVHISAPNSIYSWKSGIKNHQLEDYNVLMTEEFHKEFWTNFPDRIKAPPFYLLVNKEKEIKKSSFPENIKMEKYIILMFERIRDYFKNNLNQIEQKLINKSDKLKISFNINEKSVIDKIEYSILTKDKKETKQKFEFWKNMDKHIKSINDTILNKINVGKYSITIPLVNEND